MSTAKDLDLLLEDYAKNHVPGCGCIVMQDGKVLYEGYKGFADLKTGRPVDENTLFRLYSMTKVIVCTGALILFERGKFALNDPYSDYFPEWKETKVAEQIGNGSFVYRAPHRPIRVKDVFNMACGLPYPSPQGDHPTDKAMNEVRARLNEKYNGKYTVSQEVAAMAEVPLRFDPGEHWLYGFGHEMVAALIERCSGMKVGEFLKKEIFDPLEMKHTFYRYREGERELMATLYHIEDDGSYTPMGGMFDERFEPDQIYEAGGAGLFSNLKDYAVFTQMLANGGGWNGKRIIGKNTIDLLRANMLNETQLSEFRNTYRDGYGYGLGVRVMMDIGGVSNSTPGEFGWTGAAGTWTSIDPKNHFSAVYMHNTFPNNEEYHHMRVRAIAYGMIE